MKPPLFAALAASLAYAGMGLTLLSAAPAQGQEDRPIQPIEVTVYRDIAYNGPAVAVDEAEEDLGLAWPVNRIRVRSGRWELCERTRFHGNGITVDRDTPRLGTMLRGITIQSMRPIYDGAGSGGSNWNPEPPANDQRRAVISRKSIRSRNAMAAAFKPARAARRPTAVCGIPQRGSAG